MRRSGADMSYTELEHGYQGLKKARPSFYLHEERIAKLRVIFTSANLLKNYTTSYFFSKSSKL